MIDGVHADSASRVGQVFGRQGVGRNRGTFGATPEIIIELPIHFLSRRSNHAIHPRSDRVRLDIGAGEIDGRAAVDAAGRAGKINATVKLLSRTRLVWIEFFLVGLGDDQTPDGRTVQSGFLQVDSVLPVVVNLRRSNLIRIIHYPRIVEFEKCGHLGNQPTIKVIVIAVADQAWTARRDRFGIQVQ